MYEKQQRRKSEKDFTIHPCTYGYGYGQHRHRHTVFPTARSLCHSISMIFASIFDLSYGICVDSDQWIGGRCQLSSLELDKHKSQLIDLYDNQEPFPWHIYRDQPYLILLSRFYFHSYMGFLCG